MRRARSPRPPSGAQIFYRRGLLALIERIHDAVRTVLFPELGRYARQDATGGDDDPVGKARRRAGEIIENSDVDALAATTAKRVSDHTAREAFRLEIPIGEAAPAVGALIDGFRARNIGLITKLVGSELDRLEEILSEGSGLRVEELQELIEAAFGVTNSYAELLARDQTLKLNGQITRARHQSAGIEEYIWTTSGDERVRPGHADLDGTRQRWDTPPVVDDESGRTAHPGDDYQCRCTPYPVLPELEDEDEGA